MSDELEELDARMAEVRSEFIERLTSMMSGAFAALVTLGCRDDALEELTSIVHQLAGSAGALGFDELGLAAQDAEAAARALAEGPGGRLDPVAARELGGRMSTLFRVAALAVGRPSTDSGPRAPAPVTPRRDEAVSGSSGRRRVLVVEDAEEQRASIAAAFVASGFEVQTALDGLDGAREAFAFLPDAVVTDVRMPGISGYHLCRFLRSSPRFERTPIVVLTAHGEQVDRFWASRCGADSFLKKGHPASEVVDEVGRLLQSRAESSLPLEPSRERPDRVEVSEKVTGLMDRLLLETTLREEIAGLGRCASSLPRFLEQSLELLGQLVGFDGATICFRFDGSTLAASRGLSEPAAREEVTRSTAEHGPIESIHWLQMGAWPAGDRPSPSDRLTGQLTSQDQPIGALSIVRFEGRFGSSDRALFSLFARELSTIAVVAWSRESLARNNAQLRELQQMKDRLSELLVHDVKNVVWPAMMAVEALSAQGHLEGALRRIAEEAHKALRLLVDMLVSLLDIARMEDAALRPKGGPVDLRKLAAEVTDLHATTCHRRGVGLKVGQLPLAWGDADLLRRVLGNLIVNAVKYTQAGSVEVDGSLVDAAGGGLMVQVRVRDSGSGIPDAARGRLFQKYARAEDDAGELRFDRGLGLYFCRLAVEAHGGSISVESAQGRGSTFTFTVPADVTTFQRMAGSPGDGQPERLC